MVLRGNDSKEKYKRALSTNLFLKESQIKNIRESNQQTIDVHILSRIIVMTKNICMRHSLE